MRVMELLRGTILITETGAQIGQIYQHMKRGPYIIMSAWRGSFSHPQNRERNSLMRRRLFDEYGLACIAQKGNWPMETDNSGNIISVGNEDSLFIPMRQPTSSVNDVSEFLALAKSLMFQYDQDGVLVNDGSSTYMMNNPMRPEPKPEMERLGNDIKVVGKNQSIGDAPAWSQKGHYRYVTVDKERNSGLPA